MDEIVVRHLTACDGFSRVVDLAAESAPGTWALQSPCDEWTAADVVEHVIGFHAYLLLRPLQADAKRPRTPTEARWTATEAAIRSVLGEESWLDRNLETDTGSVSPRSFIPALTVDVLVHTWDLATAVGAPANLDRALVRFAYEQTHTNADQIEATGLYDAPVQVADDASLEAKLLARLGRSAASA